MSATALVKLAFTTKAVTHRVGEKELSFYPISLRVAFQLQCVAKPIARALTTLLTPTKQDVGTLIEDHNGPDGKLLFSTTSVMPISPELAALRVAQRCDATDALIGTLLDAQNTAVIGELFIDALTAPKDRKGAPSSQEMDEFVQALDFGSTLQLFAGVAKANASVFGDVGERVARLASQALERAVNPVAGEDSSSPSTTTTPESAGSSSKTP